jgi:hypothetical protein
MSIFDAIENLTAVYEETGRPDEAEKIRNKYKIED